jgi:hypothetical protein
MKTLKMIVTIEVPDDEDPIVVEHRVDRMLENEYGYSISVVMVE